MKGAASTGDLTGGVSRCPVIPGSGRGLVFARRRGRDRRQARHQQPRQGSPDDAPCARTRRADEHEGALPLRIRLRPLGLEAGRLFGGERRGRRRHGFSREAKLIRGRRPLRNAIPLARLKPRGHLRELALQRFQIGRAHV